MPRTILLASASPRRRALLEALGHRVIVRPVDVDESERPGEGAEAYLARIVDAKLAAAKALQVDEPFDALLVADTAVIVPAETADASGAAGQILQKPVDDADAARMLRLQGGRAHVVTTRFALAVGPRTHVESVTTRVVFRAFFPGEVEAYAASGEGRDKAGGYAIQGRAAAFIQRIEGSYGAVVGLPSCEVEVALRALLGDGER
jgi:septum formation protein